MRRFPRGNGNRLCFDLGKTALAVNNCGIGMLSLDGRFIGLGRKRLREMPPVNQSKTISQLSMFGLAPTQICRICSHAMKQCSCGETANPLAAKKKNTVVPPRPGQVFEWDGKRRLVVSVWPGQNVKNFPHDFYVEWRRPENEWRSWTMWLPNWNRWAKKATLVEKAGKKK